MMMHQLDEVIPASLVRELRCAANQRANVRQLAAIIQQHLNYPADPVIPVLAGFLRAFQVPLIKLLPIREWLGTDKDAEIDALILPEIEAAKHKWGAEDAFANGESKSGLPFGDATQPALK